MGRKKQSTHARIPEQKVGQRRQDLRQALAGRDVRHEKAHRAEVDDSGRDHEQEVEELGGGQLEADHEKEHDREREGLERDVGQLHERQGPSVREERVRTGAALAVQHDALGAY